MKSISVLLLFFTLSFSASSQDNYPWGHQLLHMFCNLKSAAPPPFKLSFETGLKGYFEESLPVYGSERKLFKLPLNFRKNFSNKILIESSWELLYHKEGENDIRLDPGDLSLFTTIFLLKEPYVSLRFGTKLPNAPNNYEADELEDGGGLSGAGTDMTDFHASVLFSKQVGSFYLHANSGFLILDDPTGKSRQLDIGTFAVGVEYSIKKTNLMLEIDFSNGPRKYDNFGMAIFDMKYSSTPLFMGFKGGVGFTSGTDDIFLHIYSGIALF